MANNKETAKRIRPMSLSTPSATDVRSAVATAEQYRMDGIGSNRSEHERIAVILACFYCVIRTGNGSALPAIAGNSPTYNRAWRAVRSALSQDEWELIKVCAVHAGQFTTTAKQGVAYLVPAGTVTKGEAPEGW
jgi:hypothetical protein